MHVRLSACRGSLVFEREASEPLGQLSGVLLHPDTGTLEGVYVAVRSFFSVVHLFCPSVDIVHWGASIEIRSTDALSPPEEIIRLQPLLEDGRTILGQRIRTESGRRLGRCADVQCNTDSMKLEWLFPRRWWHWGVALPLSDIVEVRRDAIIVRDPALAARDSLRASDGAERVSIDVLGEVAGGFRTEVRRSQHRSADARK